MPYLAQWTLLVLATLFTLPDLSYAGLLGLFGDSSSSAPNNGQQPAQSNSGDRKPVVAHFMVGNTYPYSPSDWINDIRLASSKGIDAFALNLGDDPWQPYRIKDAFTAANYFNEQSSTPFKLFFSFDMTSLPCSSPDHAGRLQSLMNSYLRDNAYFYFRQSPLVSTFAGEYCSFGQNNLNDAWYFAIKQPFPYVHFVPSFFINPQGYNNLPVIDGAFNWNSGWPTGGYSDQDYINNLGGRSYMAAVSPWFFTHYGPDTYNKNFIYRSDDWLFATRWETLADRRNDIAIAQVISWNDYGESHYVGPIEGAQPMSESWTTGYDHTGLSSTISANLL